MVLNEINDNQNSFILENKVDVNNGSGIIYITTSNDFIKMTFIDGKLVEYLSNNKELSFRDCFDAAYDDICDGMIGCIAWYTNPSIAVAVALYCGAVTGDM